MTSLGSPELVPGSVSSVYSIREAIQSYRRSQVMYSTARVVSSSHASTAPRADDEPRPGDESDGEEDLETPQQPGTRTPQEGFVSTLNWDEDDEPMGSTSRPVQHPVYTSSENHRDVQVQAATATTRRSHAHARVDERSPLLPRGSGSEAGAEAEGALEPTGPESPNSISVSAKSSVAVIGQSTFSQTLFNGTALLLGIGMLSEPLAFSYAGWICGTALIVLYGFITCYTAKYLASIVISDPRVHTYADIGKKAFGVRSMPFVNFMFCFETFSVGVVLVTLYADSLNAIIPTFSPSTYKILGLVILIPSVFIPLSLLSYASLIGIASTVFLIGVVITDGLSKFDAPGSLWSPASTSFCFGNLKQLGLAFGLFMAGFGAHAALPSLARDMAEPHRFNEAMNYSFGFATAVYALIGIVGYLMFGNDVYDEVSQNLLQVPGYNPVLNKLALWMLVVTPLTKFALATRPINFALEALCGLDTHTQEDGFETDHKSRVSRARKSNRSLKRVLLVCERISLACLTVIVSILVPDFGSIMAILGSFTVFALCVIGPIAAKISLERRATVMEVLLMMASIVMALWGTTAALWSATR